MTPGLAAWIRDFCDEHHEAEAFHKRRRDEERVDLRADGGRPAHSPARRRLPRSGRAQGCGVRGARPGEAEGPGPGFWACRRAAVAREARREAAVPTETAVAPLTIDAPEAGEAEGGRPPARSEEEILAEPGLPDPDAMGAGDDFAAFMSRAVPQALRRRALRRLWTTRPVLANLDRLVACDDDHTGGGVPMGTLATAYRVGRGPLARAERLADACAQEAGEGSQARPALARAEPGAGASTGDATSPPTAEPRPVGPRSPDALAAPLVPQAVAARGAGAPIGDAPADPAAARDAAERPDDAAGAGPTARPAGAETDLPTPQAPPVRRMRFEFA